MNMHIYIMEDIIRIWNDNGDY